MHVSFGVKLWATLDLKKNNTDELIVFSLGHYCKDVFNNNMHS